MQNSLWKAFPLGDTIKLAIYFVVQQFVLLPLSVDKIHDQQHVVNVCEKSNFVPANRKWYMVNDSFLNRRLFSLLFESFY